MSNIHLLADFKQFISTFERKDTDNGDGWVTTEHTSTDGRWWYNGTPGFDDFNKEVCPAGKVEHLPDGAVGIRSDDDFWTEAIFPLKFCHLSIEEMVSILWPHINARFNADTVSV